MPELAASRVALHDPIGTRGHASMMALVRPKQPAAAHGPGRLPNLLVIGAQKAGTTWLHRRLAEHPRILMSKKKELNLFGDPNYTARLDEYRASFPTIEGKQFYGESTPGYFWTWDAQSPWCSRYLNGNRDIPGSVLRTLGPETRLLLSLRHPVERAVSAFFHHFRRGRVGPEARLTEFGMQFGIVDIGFYGRHWRAWTRSFEGAAPIVVAFDNIVRDPAGVMRDVLRRLGLEPAIGVSPQADHVGFRMRVRGKTLEIDGDVPANLQLAARWGCDIASAPRVHAEDLEALAAVYRDDIGFCQDLLGDAADFDWAAPRQLESFVSSR